MIDVGGYLPLYYAINGYRALHTTNRYLELGADPTAVDAHGRTPLQYVEGDMFGSPDEKAELTDMLNNSGKN